MHQSIFLNHQFQCAATYDRSDSNSNQMQNSAGGPRAKKVSLSSTGTDTPFMPTPPDSPVFAELTTPGQDIKPDVAKLNKRLQEQEGTQAVPNLEMNPSLYDFYNHDNMDNMNTGKFTILFLANYFIICFI